MTALSTKDSWQVVVVGAGAAGLMAAVRAAERGRRVLLVEKNNKPGVKILMSGGTRCNLTHATDRQGIASAFERSQARFLQAPLAALGPDELVDLLHREGLSTKVEATGKVFPTSDRALDVQRTLLAMLARSGAELALGEGVVSVERHDSGFRVTTDRRTLYAASVIIASGGQSYPGCGTTGDGYAWAKSFGHSIVPPRPALVPLKVSAPWVHELSGVTVSEAGLSIVARGSKKPLVSRQASLLFTHFGFSGPAAMDVSRAVTAHPTGHTTLQCDFVPGVHQHQLEQHFRQLSGKQSVLKALPETLPRRLAESLLATSDVPIDRQAAEFSKRELSTVVQALKASRFELSGTQGFAKAEVTAGGVTLDEVDSKTLASRLAPGLYLVGEVLDVDGPIGGYNFQAAFSTGWLAGDSV